MNNRIKIVCVFVLSISYLLGNGQNNAANDQVFLFTDRDYCVSGDTLWFKAWLPGKLEEKSNVVHVQLDTKNGNLISSVAKKSVNGWAQGYVHVPDSLSSGLCFVTAFLNFQRDSVQQEVVANALYVYNRFEERISELVPVDAELRVKQLNYDDRINLAPDKNNYSPREKVNLKIESNSEEISKVVVKARLLDPFSYENGGNYRFNYQSSNRNIPLFTEKNGVLISGKVSDNQNNPKQGALVVLSITDDPPYFDYAITGKSGDFHFYLKNAVGNAPVVIQALSKYSEEFFIETEINSISRLEYVFDETKMLTPEESEFIASVIEANFINKLFYPPAISSKDTFSMPLKYEVPFYGPPTARVIPAEYFDLPGFQEISRELLHGLQYRVRNDEITFRMLNTTMNTFFNNEPLRLLNGIPIFKNSLLASLKSTDIEYIDLVQSERIFGDLLFKGILAISLYDKSNSWMVQQPNVYKFNLPCLQPDASPGYMNKKEIHVTLPDTRQVYFWNVLNIAEDNVLEFDLSDMKGKIEISVEGVTGSNQPFKSSKIIEVK